MAEDDKNENLNNANLDRRIKNADLTTTMRDSFLSYAMSVIVARALPDVRDGLKPVHRRILYGMNELGITPDKPHKKSARIVGDVMGKYHPHGDSAIYESMVRMAQNFSYRYMLIDGHGNFGSIDGDPAAAMRYTESRLSKIALEMLRDINKDTVDFVPTYDGDNQEPEILPSRFPNLLVNGAMGIAVGMATNIPTHNLREVIEAIHILMKNSDVTVDELMKVLPGPDFPTGAIVMGKSGIKEAYETGKGKVTVRAKVDIETSHTGKETIAISELPYNVNKSKLIERVRDLVGEKKLEGITAIRDESDRDGYRVAIDVSRDVNATVVLNNLYKLTPVQTSFSFNMIAIDHGRPKLMGLKEILSAYLDHQRIIIRRRTIYDLKRSKDRAHILEGLRIALDYIDEIINLIRSSQTVEIAKNELINRYKLSDKQATAILDMRLARLTGLERDKIEKEYQDLLVLIADLEDILAKAERIDEIIYNELLDISAKFGDDRRTELQVADVNNIEDEDLIDEEDIIISLTSKGYIKRLATTEFKTQNRGGRGVQGMNTHDDDFVKNLVSTSTHDTLLFFTDQGKVYKIKGYEVPEYGRQAKGIPVVNLLGIQNNETVQAVINVRGDAKESENYLMFTTLKGVVKRTAVSEFSNIRQNGLRAITLKDDDSLVNVQLTDGKQNIIIASHLGYSVSFAENDVRVMGRTAGGVRGMKLRSEDYVIGSDVLTQGSNVLIITEKGYGKQTPVDVYPIRGRGGKGFKTAHVTDKNGPLAGLAVVNGEEDIMVTTIDGVMIRFISSAVSITGRATQGVRVIRVGEKSKVATLAKVIHDDESEINSDVLISADEQKAEASTLTEDEKVIDETEEIENENISKISDLADQLIDEENNEN
ncbi:MAG: DNA gyrase subunit A [Lactobacillaceae bacterium]|jgi:DNA gyrase subunit A|nr:DNA gyrase subunit A [Lactobacillaceae bacterium]